MARLNSNHAQQLLIRDMQSPKEAFRSIRNYLAGQFVGATRDETLLDELLKILFCKLYVERGLSSTYIADADAVERAKHVRHVFAQVRSDFPDIYPEGTEILLDPEAITFVLDDCNFQLLSATSDPIGDAFEVFVGSESRSRSGQFFTPRSVTDLLVEVIDPQPEETVVDPACGAGGFLTSVARHYIANGVEPDHVAELVSQNLYGIDKDAYLSKLALMHTAVLTGGHPHILCADSIALHDGEKSITDQLPKDGFDVLLTNPPFGTKIVAANPNTLRTFDLARRWRINEETQRLEPTSEFRSSVPPQVLFVERCLNLLREGGRMGIVVPESILSNKSYRYVVEYLLAHADISAVIGMPEALFKTSGKGGTHTKTCLLVATKGKSRGKTIFMAEAKWCGHDSRARTIPNNDLPKIAENLALFRRGKPLNPTPLGFLTECSDVVSNVLCPRYYDPQISVERTALSETHDLPTFSELVSEGVLSVQTGDELGKLAYGTGDIPFIRTSDISNWEIKADPKHEVNRQFYEALQKKQDVQVRDIFMVKDGTYLVGTCAMVSYLDTQIVYQSHLYKIRVHENNRGLDSYLLLAILSSPFVLRQVKSKQFSQDIIDSLGDRIHELVLPIPKVAQTRKRISEMVSSSVCKRIEARELSHAARAEVAGIGR
ncbi:MAG: N-6 DNA methylase [Armatimonadetes bacterium]|nr:N-6 DNA methylase [Armatimonadota bacterium]